MYIAADKVWVCTHIDPTAVCAECILHTYDTKKELLNTELELLELKNKFLQKVLAGERGDSVSIQAFNQNAYGRPHINTPVNRVYVWKFGGRFAVDTQGKLYRATADTPYWLALTSGDMYMYSVRPIITCLQRLLA